MIASAAAILAAAAFFWILFIRREDIPEPVPVSPVQHLEDRKQAIYESLRDLQFEFRLGKLSDEDYKSSKLALQRELALVLAETEDTLKRLGLTPVRVGAKVPGPTSKPSTKRSGATLCPHCGASFPQSLRFCGQCGKAIA